MAIQEILGTDIGRDALKLKINQNFAELSQLTNSLDANKVNKAWGTTYQAVLQNGWTGTLEYSINDLGEVWIRGAITAPVTVVVAIITIVPVGYKPPQNTAINAYNVDTLAVVNDHFVITLGGELYIRTSNGISAGNGIRINYIFKV